VFWWDNLQCVINLLQPVSDAIHQLEADRPLLSQVLGVWNKLRASVKAWVAAKGDPTGKAQVRTAAGGREEGRGGAARAQLQGGMDANGFMLMDAC
jgi:hypothetical protein